MVVVPTLYTAVISQSVPESVKSSSSSTEVELHLLPGAALLQPTVAPATLFAVSVADQMGVLEVCAVGVAVTKEVQALAVCPELALVLTRNR